MLKKVVYFFLTSSLNRGRGKGKGSIGPQGAEKQLRKVYMGGGWWWWWYRGLPREVFDLLNQLCTLILYTYIILVIYILYLR